MHGGLITRSYTSVGSAFEKIMQYVKIKPKPEMASTINAYKRILAESIISKANVPAYDTSHMDGFAVKAKEISSASHFKPIVLRIKPKLQLDVLKSSFSHYRIDNKLTGGEAAEVSTGDYLPKGADTVIPIEELIIIGNKVKISSPFPKGAFVYPAGTDIKNKQRIFSKGQLLRTQDIGLLGSLGIKNIVLFKKPKIALIPTGSELSDDLEHIESGRKFNTNSKVIAKLIEEFGALPIDFGITSDDVNEIRQKISNALTASDLVLTMAGTSVGKYDLIQTAINSLGKPGMIAHGLKLDRGRVAGVAVLKGKPIVALPGPIQGALNAFIVFGYPIIRNLLGRSEKKIGLMFYATLTKFWEARKRFPDFLKVVYVKLSYSQNGFKAEPLIGQTESMSLLSKANGYVLVPEKIRKMSPGEIVVVHLIPGFSNINGEFI
jgi:molybdenum cofactor synthesis domain-containing protein